MGGELVVPLCPACHALTRVDVYHASPPHPSIAAPGELVRVRRCVARCGWKGDLA